MCSTWFGQSGKGRSNPRQYGPKKLPPTICWELLLGPSVWTRGPTVKVRKKASRRVLSLSSWTADTYFNRQETSQEIKVKLNKSQLPKFYQQLKIKQLKENSTENSAEKNFKEDLKLNEHWNISTKKEKKNTQIQRTFFSRTLSQIGSCKLH